MKKIRGKAVKDSTISQSARIGAGSWIINSTLDRYSYCGYDCAIFDTQIGSFCSIANNVSIGISNHPIDWVSTSPVFSAGKNILGKNFSVHEVDYPKTTIIGHDVWIGGGVYIKSGVSIGTGAIIGMGSVVTKDVGPYEIWAGNPARLIRKRFNDVQIEKLLMSKWWLESEKNLQEIAIEFNKTEKFTSKIGEEF